MRNRSGHSGLVMGIVIGLAICLSPTMVGAAADESVRSREVKFLLRPALFAELLPGLERFWQLVTDTARRQGMAVTAAGEFPGKEKTRYVSFFDTAGFDLYRRGYLLRKRGTEADEVGDRPGSSQRKISLAFKFRSPQLLFGMLERVRPASGLDGEAAIEEDCVADTTAVRRIYSFAGSVEIPANRAATLTDYCRYFPGLAKVGIEPHSALVPVRNVIIREYSIKPGSISLGGGIDAAVTMSVWWRVPELKPCVVEFSFKYPIAANGAEKVYRLQRAADALIRALQRSARSWILDGATKTSLVYGSSAAHQE